MFRPVLFIFCVLRIGKVKNSFLFLLCHCNNGSDSPSPQHRSIRRTCTGWSRPPWTITMKLPTAPSRSYTSSEGMRPLCTLYLAKQWNYCTSPQTLSLRFNSVAGTETRFGFSPCSPPGRVSMGSLKGRGFQKERPLCRGRVSETWW